MCSVVLVVRRVMQWHPTSYCLVVDFIVLRPSYPLFCSCPDCLLRVKQSTVPLASKSCHVGIATNICVKRVTGWLEGNIGNFAGGGSVTAWETWSMAWFCSLSVAGSCHKIERCRVFLRGCVSDVNSHMSLYFSAVICSKCWNIIQNLFGTWAVILKFCYFSDCWVSCCTNFLFIPCIISN